jgi:pyruvate formate lyase activating enzyme
MKTNKLEPLVFDIARGSFVDGPGIRTVVFMKGCPLRCRWCQNPESQKPGKETLFYPENCIGCGQCETGGDEACNSLAKRVAGQYYPPKKLAQLVTRDRVFYQTSSGGVTFSGGEPLLFIDYIHEVAQLLHEEEIHIAVETCGYFDFEKIEDTLLPLIDLFLFDIKIMDPVKHEEYTGKSNEVILRNFEKLAAAGVNMTARIPLVPGFTAVEENLSQIAAYFLRRKVAGYALLPYNPSGLKKWERLGKQPPENVSPKPMTVEEETKWMQFFKERMKPI